MKLKELAEIALVGSRVAARDGRIFRIDPSRLKGQVTPEDIAKVERAVADIERFTRDALATL